MNQPQTNPWPERADRLHVARVSLRCTVLGPGVRAVVWVQGCPFRCPDCVATEMLPFSGGEVMSTTELAQQLIDLPEIEGVTFSGGEPLAQAAALCELIDQLRRHRDLTTMSYTGYTLQQLQQGTAAQRALLHRLDLLVDGLYVASRHTDLRWRGSDNQTVHFLSDRYRHLAEQLDQRGRWIEFELPEDGTLRWMGIPPAGFRAKFAAALGKLGIELVEEQQDHERIS